MAKEASDESWWGTWAEVAFNVDRSTPYITLPREIARIESINVCDRPIQVQNQFYEYLQFGNGRLPKRFRRCDPRFVIQALSRNNTPTFTDLSNAPQTLAVYPTEAADAGKRVLFQGTDANGSVIYTQDNLNRVTGVFVSIQQPFSTAPMTFGSITGIQKDITAGQVQIFQVDPTTGTQVLLVTMEPTETTAWYRRIYLDALPCGCCPTPSVPAGQCQTVQVTAIVKLDLIPVMVDTDYLVIQELEAIIHECQAVRYSEMDTAVSQQMEQNHHIAAIRLLNGQLTHFLGLNSPAVNFSPFGSARLERVRIGMI